jgi:ACS family tartrate transporter-like MFS transporter
MDALSSLSLSAPASTTEIDADATEAKVTRRLMPFLVACFFVAYLDRVNIGFAALSMNAALGFSPVIFGWGAGIFFIGYCLLEAPSNYVMERVGARRWIARIMVSWGIVAALMAIVWSETSLFVLRFLLGAAEAGFAPGVILYLTYWIPARYRARSLGAFLIALPLSSMGGAPVSGLVLATMDGVTGVSAWRWLFVIEAAPAVLLGVAAYFYLTDKPENAAWLAPRERALLQGLLDEERSAREAAGNPTLWRTLFDPRVIALGLVYFGVVASLYGLGFWLPQIVGAFGYGAFETGLVTAIPYVCGAVAMVAWSRHSDESGERIRHVAAAAVLSAAGLALSACFETPAPSIIALCVASIGTLAAMPPFWALPTAFLSGTAAAVGIALVNSIGNLAGFFGPYLVGWIKNATGEFSYALLALAVGPLVSAILVICLGRKEGSDGPRNLEP